MPVRVITRQQQLAMLARKQRHILAVYFYTGVLLAPPHLPHLQTSSSTITRNTLFVSHQKGHRS